MHELKVSAELRLLMDASLEDLSSKSAGDLQHIDWDRLARLARWHQVRPLLFDYLPSENLPHAGIPVYRILKEFALGQAVANMAFLGLSVRLYDALVENGVPAFPMKGALWSWMLYKKPTNREFGDIDFFIEQDSVRKSLGILAEHGFYPDDYRAHLLQQHEKDYLATDYQLPLEPAEEHALQSLEVQWNVSYPRYGYNLLWKDLARNMIDFKLMQRTVKVPRMENQLLMMVIHHGGIEQWDKLKYAGDFVRLLQKYAIELDWSYMTAAARSRSFYKLLVHAVYLAQIITKEDFLHYLPDQNAKSYIAESFITSTIGHWENARAAPKTKTWRIFRFNFMYRDSWKCRLSLMTAHISYFLRWQLLWAKLNWYREHRF